MSWNLFSLWFKSLPMFDVFYCRQIKVSIVFVFIFDNFFSQIPTLLFCFLSDTNVELLITSNLVLLRKRWLIYNPLFFVSGNLSCISPTLRPLNFQEIKCLISFKKIFLNMMLTMLLSFGLLNVLRNKSEDWGSLKFSLYCYIIKWFWAWCLLFWYICESRKPMTSTQFSPKYIAQYILKSTFFLIICCRCFRAFL